MAEGWMAGSQRRSTVDEERQEGAGSQESPKACPLVLSYYLTDGRYYPHQTSFTSQEAAREHVRAQFDHTTLVLPRNGGGEVVIPSKHVVCVEIGPLERQPSGEGKGT